ncbi:hypothetical protein THAOC_18804 [Thalassiosira oceanica]|uniref:Uncharacterized protein n=1 Tax=Thalassiosira oceanica TaxID=159749 RepID=K0S6C2_THAOC|nr:hypothetical protein THAOC_18804 [Thalassiosira oceanica]|eukprot:EJK60785.1 hypothetical protein THAOC_18804 [Thalassiosira oceanica]
MAERRGNDSTNRAHGSVAKVQSDPSALSEQISLVRSMLKLAGPLSSIKEDEALLAVIAYRGRRGGFAGGENVRGVPGRERPSVLADVEKDPGERSVDREEGDGAADDAEAGMKNLSVDGGATAGRKLEPAAAVGKTAGLDDPFGGGSCWRRRPRRGTPSRCRTRLGAAVARRSRGLGVRERPWPGSLRHPTMMTSTLSSRRGQALRESIAIAGEVGTKGETKGEWPSTGKARQIGPTCVTV